MFLTKRRLLKGLLVLPLSLKHILVFAEKSQHLRICFGSCNKENEPQNHWAFIESFKPKYWFWLGDNIYANTKNPKVMRKKYTKLLKSKYSNFKQKTSIEGIWDDHDFGEDGSNRTYPFKEQSQKMFLDFMGAPLEDERRSREGIYYSKDENIGEKRIKFIFLDCRYFKDPQKGREHTLIGETQFQWVEEVMANSNADAHIIVSPIGFLVNKVIVTEDWAEYPDDRKRLLGLIEKYSLPGTFFLSGDKHFGALIEKRVKTHTFYEFQSSGLTHASPKTAAFLIEKLYGRKKVLVEKNFGRMDFYVVGNSLKMSWNLHSIDRKRKKIEWDFELHSNGYWKKI